MHRKIILIVCLLLAAASLASAQDAGEVFDRLYGAKLKQAAATVDRADDVALATEMLGVAKANAGQAALLARLCEAAYDLGAKSPEGYGVAIEAMELLAASTPAKRDTSRERIAALLLRQTNTGKQESRDKAMDALIQLHVDQAGERMEKKEYGDAAGFYRKALLLAQRRKSPELESIKERTEAAVHFESTMKRIGLLQEKLLKDANDQDAAAELVRLYAAELDDPAGASPYAQRAGDEQLKRCVALAGKDVATLTEAEAALLADWYGRLASESRSPAKLGLLVRAEALLLRYLALHTQEDLARVERDVALKSVREQLARLRAASATKPATDPKRNPFEGKWTSTNGEETVIIKAAGGKWSVTSSLVRGGTQIGVWHGSNIKAERTKVVCVQTWDKRPPGVGGDGAEITFELEGDVMKQSWRWQQHSGDSRFNRVEERK